MTWASSSRQERGLAQRLLLEGPPRMLGPREAQVQVIGSKGDVYSVALLNETTSCSCPDYANRQEPCKHIYFVLSRVLRLDSLLWKKGTGFSENQVYTVFQALHSYLANRWAIEGPKPTTEPDPEAKEVVSRKSLQEQVECPLCLEEFQDKEVLVFCQTQCGYNFHKACFLRCLSKGCPMCRAKHL